MRVLWQECVECDPGITNGYSGMNGEKDGNVEDESKSSRTCHAKLARPIIRALYLALGFKSISKICGV